MPSFRRRKSVTGADGVDESSSDAAAGLNQTQSQTQALAEEAEAEAAEAEARAMAARARARAIRLRREAEQGADLEERGDDVGPENVDLGSSIGEADDSTVSAEDSEDPAVKSRRSRVPRPTWKGIAATVVLLCTAALLAGSGYMIWNHRQAEKLQHQNAEFAAAARQGVVTLMSLDYTRAQEDVQRIIDISTGAFKDDFEHQVADFVAVAQDSEVMTEVTVNSTAVETMAGDSAVVLVAASSRVSNSAGADQEPRSWRLSVGLQREEGQIKMSKVEFVP